MYSCVGACRYDVCQSFCCQLRKQLQLMKWIRDRDTILTKAQALYFWFYFIFLFIALFSLSFFEGKQWWLEKKNLLINPNISFVSFRERHASRDLSFIFARSFVLYTQKPSFRGILSLWNSCLYKKKKPSSDSHVTAQHTQYRIFHVDKIKKIKKVLLFCVVYIHLNCYHQIEVNLRKNI